MAKDKHANKVEDCLRQYGWTTRSEKSKKPRKDEQGNYVYVSGERTGEADILAIRGKVGVFIEVKTFGKSFAISSYSEDQIEWGKQKIEEGSEVWCWFFGGDDPPNRDINKTRKDGNPYRPRKAWLIPLPKVLDAFKRYETIRKSIPYGDQSRMSPIIRENNLTFVEMFFQYEMRYVTGNNWEFYYEHPFGQEFMPEEELVFRIEPKYEIGEEVRLTNQLGYFTIEDFDKVVDGKWTYKISQDDTSYVYQQIPEDLIFRPPS